MIEDGGPSPFLWMGVGFAIALLILLGAFFQDIVVAIGRRLLVAGERAVAPVYAGASRWLARLGRGGRLERRPVARPRPRLPASARGLRWLRTGPPPQVTTIDADGAPAPFVDEPSPARAEVELALSTD